MTLPDTETKVFMLVSSGEVVKIIVGFVWDFYFFFFFNHSLKFIFNRSLKCNLCGDFQKRFSESQI